MTKLNNEQFDADMARAKTGKLTDKQVDALVRKWGARGGAFYGFFSKAR